jgi:hypothetical protein
LSPDSKREVFFLVADGGMAEVVKAFLGRDQFHRSLGCGRFDFDADEDIRPAPTKDPGVYSTAHELLQPFEHSHRRAVVMVDADWDGTPGSTIIRERITQCLAGRWQEFVVIVIEPELEAWIMNDNQHVGDVLRCPDYRKILADTGAWPEGVAKPARPKEALEYLRKHHRVRAFNADFGKLAGRMSVRQCQDPAFMQLREQLCAWFPVTP